MTELPTKTETYICVGDSDLEWFIKQETGHEVCISELANCGNDTNLVYNVETIKDLYIEDWNEFKASGERCGLITILDGLCGEGKIKPGKYLINVSW
jgi:hypothetical protein